MKLRLNLKFTFAEIFITLLLVAFSNVCTAQDEDFPETVDVEVAEELTEPQNDTPEEDAALGTLLFSVSNDMPFYGQYNFQIVNLQTYQKRQIPLVRQKDLQHFRDGITDVYYNAFNLPEGDYKIFGWTLRTGKMTYFPLANISFPFKVVAGKINYLGDYFVKIVEVKNWSPIPKKHLSLVVSDRFDIDYKQITDRFPLLQIENNTVNAIPDFQGKNTKYSGIQFKGVGAP